MRDLFINQLLYLKTCTKKLIFPLTSCIKQKLLALEVFCSFWICLVNFWPLQHAWKCLIFYHIFWKKELCCFWWKDFLCLDNWYSVYTYILPIVQTKTSIHYSTYVINLCTYNYNWDCTQHSTLLFKIIYKKPWQNCNMQINFLWFVTAYFSYQFSLA